jgi:guanylate kinase/nucleoside diphosphate kinase
MKSSPANYHRLAKSQVGKTQRALLMFKPDAVALGQCAMGMRLLAQKLQEAKVNFRFVAPQLLAATPSFINAFYAEHVEKSWYGKRLLPFMTGTHSDPLVKQAPLLTAVIEAETRDMDLFQLLRQDHIIGPTNPERQLLGLERDEHRTGQIMQSVRYLLTLGSGARLYLLHRQDHTPMYNRLHCSANEADAAVELLLSYGTLQSLADFYTDGALSALLAEWKTKADAAPVASMSIPLWRSLEENQSPVLLQGFAKAGFDYRNFGENELRRLIFEVHQLLPLLGRLDQNFTVNAGDRVPQSLLETEIFPPEKPRAVLIGISGTPGSGKTTIANALMGKLGLTSAVHVTTYKAEAEASVSEEYLYLPEEAFMEGLAQGELVGISRFREWGKYYSVLKSSLDDLAARGGTGVLVCGANTLAYVREHVRDSNIVFRTLFVCPPDLAEAKSRMQGRGRPGDEERYAEHRSVGQRILGRSGEFDLVVPNDNLETAVGLAAQYVEKTIAGETLETARPPAEIITPRQMVIEYLWGRLFETFRTTYDRIQTNSLESIRRSARKLYREELKRFLTEVRKETQNLSHLSKADEGVVENVTDHTLDVFASAVLGSQPAQAVTRSAESLGRLAVHGSPPRVADNLEKIRKLSESIPLQDRIIIAILHDLGKPKGYLLHHIYSDQLIERYGLMDATPSIPAQRKTLIKMAIKYHLALGCLAFSVFTLVTSGNMFSDPELREVLANHDGSVNLERVRTFLDYLLYITIADVAGRPGKRGIRNLLIEAYSKWHERLRRLAAENRASYDNFLAAMLKNAPQHNLERLSGKTASADVEMDRREEGWAYHDQILIKARDRALQEGIFDRKDWQFLLNNLQYITDEWYTPLSFLARVDSRAGTVSETILDETNPNLLKFYIFSLRIGRENIPDLGPGNTFALAFTGFGGDYITRLSSMKASALELDRIMRKAQGFGREGEDIYFTDREGRKIEDVKITLSHAPAESVMTVHFKNLS